MGDTCLAQADAEARAAELGLRAMRQKEGGHEAALRRASAAQAISPISPLYLPYTSPISPLYLPYICGSPSRERGAGGGGGPNPNPNIYPNP